ncbi:MAG: methyltransferase domain-containing protein [Verrucomicrobiota bacterium]
MKRTPLQGLLTVVRFNWHFFAIAAGIIVAFALAGWFLPSPFSWLAWLLAGLAVAGILIPLAATAYAYDFSAFYNFLWLDPWMENTASAANIHAGFDETTALFRVRYSAAWHVFDFYDPAKHTEVSIRRARASATPDPQTITIFTNHIPLPDQSLDRALLILAAHEIRDSRERAEFFGELRRVVKPGGTIIVAEHLRDAANVLAYGPGAWHFHTRAAWCQTFSAGGWRIADERKANALLTTFLLS